VHDSVVFRGDRLEQYFVDDPGNWEGIHFLRSSHDNEINYAVIKEAIVGIRVDSLKETSAPKLTLRNTLIRYTLSSGITWNNVRYLRGELPGTTVVVEWDVQLEFGGNYQFENCTFANYSSVLINHQSPVVRMSNYFAYKDSVGNDVVNLADLNANFRNCIIYGSLENELDRDPNSSAVFSYQFDHCLMKLTDTVNVDNPSFNAILKNQDPAFADPSEADDYHLTENSPCIDAGISNGIFIDLDGNSRPQGVSWDIGCYEFIE
jgi:hypothetical protein